MATDDLVLVTGARGFIGKHCVAALLAKGFRVRGTVRQAKAAEEARAAVGTSPGDRLEFVEADLLADAGWDAAVAGCRYVLHVASVFPLMAPAEREALVPVAREGTLRVLRAAARAGVSRTVVTSSVVAIAAGHPPRGDHAFTEDDWTVVDNPAIGSYAVSKTRAERAAWDFIAGKDAGAMTMATINPALVLGPPLDGHVDASGDVIRMFLSGRAPFVPHLSVGVVDVRDVAAAEVAALEVDAAGGQRFICSGGMLSLKEIGDILGRHFPRYRRKLPHGEIPDIVLRTAAAFSRRLRVTLAEAGGRGAISAARAERVLGIAFRPPEEAVVEMARALIAYGRA